VTLAPRARLELHHRVRGRPEFGRRDSAALRGEAAPTPLRRTAPADVVTFAGVQGGAGVSTLTLLVCLATTAHSDRAALAIDLAAATPGGLGARAGAHSQTTAEATAYLVVDGHALQRPYARTADGVHVISPVPDTAVRVQSAALRMLSRLADAARAGASPDETAAIVGEGLAEHELEQLIGERSREQRDALHHLIAGSRDPHSLVAIDLGLADPETLIAFAPHGHLHVWLVAARDDDLELAQRRLRAMPACADRELIAAWIPPDETASGRELRALAQTRGCPLVRMATFDARADWMQRAATCRRSLEELCAQLG
jgi:hypothetical protein